MFKIFKNAAKSFARKITDIKLTESEFDDVFFELEVELISQNYTPEIIDVLREELRLELVNKSTKHPEKEIKKAITNVFNKTVTVKELSKEIQNSHKPVKILFIGFNGVGKTTTIAKIAYLLKKQKMTSVISASDTFRSASVEQLQFHADKVGVKVINQKYGADPVAVAFDSVKHAESKNIDTVLIDTAGRSYDNINLMNELTKMKRVIKPDITILVLDSLTGSDLINQISKFGDLGITGLVLTKTDSDVGGGAVLSAPYALKTPIYYLGTGQNYEDLKIPKIEELLKEIF